MNESTKNKIYFGSRLALGGLLVVAALSHLSNPYQFFSSVASYQVFDMEQSKIIAGWIPFVQIVCGLSLITNVGTRGSATVVFMLFLGIGIVQVMGLLYGLGNRSRGAVTDFRC